MILYNFLMWLISFISPVLTVMGGKTKLWVEGRKGLIKRTEQLFKDKNEDVIWFHCASLGEFEQGRQLIEDFRADYPNYKIVVTFFSPSGYEPRKNYTGADYILYVPLDTRMDARRFVAAMRPKIVVFVKYEFWNNLLRESKKAGAKLYVVSAIFNQKQYFFKWYGAIGRKALRYFDHIFVQDENSVKLLSEIGITKVSVAGDTRFDRVYTLASKAKTVVQMEHFAATDRPIFVAGSTWEPDDDLIIEMVKNFPQIKFVIVPHELPRQKIISLKERCEALGRRTICYTDNEQCEADVMIIDTVGILSSTYRYATMAYIGGGFGTGIHNTLEAATYGLPIAFGPNYARFAEANDLISIGSACSVNNSTELMGWVSKLLTNKILHKKCCEQSRTYVEKKIGATRKILDFIKDDTKINL